MPSYRVLEQYLRAGRNPSRRNLSSSNLTVRTTRTGLGIYSYDLLIYEATPEEVITLQGFESTPTTRRHLSQIVGGHLYSRAHGFQPFDGMQVTENGQLLNPPWVFDKTLVVEGLTALCQIHGEQRPHEQQLSMEINEGHFLLRFVGQQPYLNRCVSRRKAVSLSARDILESQGWPVPGKSFTWNHQVRGLQVLSEHEIMQVLVKAS
jgi:hypothetical protein